MPKKIEISEIRAEQFNKMVEMLRDIRRYEVKKMVAAKKREGYSREQALELVVKTLQQMAIPSRGIAELKEVSNG